MPPPLPNATDVPPMLAATMPPSTITRCALFMRFAFRVADVDVRSATHFGAHSDDLTYF